MRTSLSDLLDQKQLLLADGALGTNFMNMGLEPGYPPDLWNLTCPEKPEALHQMFADAGSDILLTNTFGANGPRLKLHDAQDETYAINKAGAEIAGRVATRSDRPIVIGGSVGPTGELFEPMGAMTFDSCKAVFLEQIQGLKDGGADVVWIKTSQKLRLSGMSQPRRIDLMASTRPRPYCVAGRQLSSDRHRPALG